MVYLQCNASVIMLTTYLQRLDIWGNRNGARIAHVLVKNSPHLTLFFSCKSILHCNKKSFPYTNTYSQYYNNTTKTVKNQQMKCVKEQKYLRRHRYTPSLRLLCSTNCPWPVSFPKKWCTQNPKHSLRSPFAIAIIHPPQCSSPFSMGSSNLCSASRLCNSLRNTQNIFWNLQIGW